MLQRRADLVRHSRPRNSASRPARSAAPVRPAPCLTARHRLGGILVAQRIVEAERAPRRNFLGTVYRLRVVAKQPQHLLGGLHVPLGVPEYAVAGLVDGAVLADARQHVLERAPRQARDSGRRSSPPAASHTTGLATRASAGAPLSSPR